MQKTMNNVFSFISLPEHDLNEEDVKPKNTR